MRVQLDKLDSFGEAFNSILITPNYLSVIGGSHRRSKYGLMTSDRLLVISESLYGTENDHISPEKSGVEQPMLTF